MKVYQLLATTITARKNCLAVGNLDWLTRHEERVRDIEKEWLPRGSGFDVGTSVDLIMSSDKQLVLRTSYHHMNEAGMYDRWTDHTVYVGASLQHGFTLRISGKNYNDIKEYIAQVFLYALEKEVE